MYVTDSAKCVVLYNTITTVDSKRYLIKAIIILVNYVPIMLLENRFRFSLANHFVINICINLILWFEATYIRNTPMTT